MHDTSQDDNLWHCRDCKVLFDSVLREPAGRSPPCDSSNWWGCIQCAWSQLHSLLGIPVRGDFRDLEGQRLHAIQESVAGADYLIVDEMSMVGRKLLGQVDKVASGIPSQVINMILNVKLNNRNAKLTELIS